MRSKMARGVICGLLLMALSTVGAFVLGETNKSSEPEISFSDGVPIVPSIRPVIIVSGTDYEIGYQWFQQYSQVFGPWILKEMQKQLTPDQKNALKAYQVNIKKYAPEWVDMMRGMAKAATDAGVPLSYAEVMAEFVVTKTFPNAPAGAAEETLPTSCSGFSAWGSTTKDGKLICAGIGDMNLIKYEHTVIVFPKTGNNFIASPYYREDSRPGNSWYPLHPAMNNKGLAYVHHGQGVPGNEPGTWSNAEDYGVPWSIATMHTLRFANNAKQALEMSLAYPGWQHGQWADVSGDAFVLESRKPLAVRRAGDLGEKDFIFSTNNVASKNLEQFVPQSKNAPARFIEHAGWLSTGASPGVSSISRNLEIWNMLHNYQGQVDADFVKMMLRYPGTPPAYPTLEEADAAYAPTLGKGWDQTIGSLTNEMIGVLAPDNGNNGLMWVSSFCVGRVAYAHGPGGVNYPVAPTFSFYQLKLDADPAKVVEAAVARARYDLYYANTELRKLAYRDVAYGPLNDIYDKAATEWTKGFFYQKLAKNTTGNESVSYYGKALRAFTRSQAYANQVRETLAPPPTSPKDLGLKAWFGPDGDWFKFPQ